VSLPHLRELQLVLEKNPVPRVGDWEGFVKNCPVLEQLALSQGLLGCHWGETAALPVLRRLQQLRTIRVGPEYMEAFAACAMRWWLANKVCLTGWWLSHHPGRPVLTRQESE
jgi:hypothetical protein